MHWCKKKKKKKKKGFPLTLSLLIRENWRDSAIAWKRWSSSPEKLVLVAVEPNGIASITINGPKLLTSWTKAMRTDLAQVLKAWTETTLSGSAWAVDLTAAENNWRCERVRRRGEVLDRPRLPRHIDRCERSYIHRSSR